MPKAKEQDWEAAKRFANNFAKLPSSFVVCIRHLLKSTRPDDPFHLGDDCKFMLKRLLNSYSVKAPFYFAARTFFPDKVAEKANLSDLEILGFFRSDEIAVMLSSLLLYRVARRNCPKEDWDMLSPKFEEAVDLGMHLGYAIPQIGPLRGLLVGAMRNCGFAAILAGDKSGFVAYRRHLKSRRRICDFEYEEAKWGCNHVHVACLIMQALGFSSQLTYSFQLAMLEEATEKLDAEAKALKVARLWVDSLVLSGAPPDTKLGDEYIIEDAALENFAGLIEDIKKNGSKYRWMSRSRKDVTPADCPQICKKPLKETKIIETDAEDLALDSEEAFTDEELAKIGQEKLVNEAPEKIMSTTELTEGTES